MSSSAHSGNALDDRQLQLIRRLAVFDGGFSPEAAEVMTWDKLPELPGSNVWAVSMHHIPPGPPSAHLVETLHELTSTRILQRHDGIDGAPRYELSEAIRAAALRKPNQGIERSRLAHATYFVAFAEAIDARVFGVDSVYWFGRTALELDNIRAALGWTEASGETMLGLRLATALWLFWQSTGLADEGFAWLERSLARQVTPSRERAAGLTVAGFLAWFRDDLAAASTMLDEALHYWRSVGHEFGIARALFAQVLVAWRRGDVGKAVMLLEESRAHFLTAHDTVGPSLCLIVQAILARYGGQFDQSLQLLTEAASLAAFEEFVWGIGIAHYYEGEVHVDRGDYPAALSAYRACLLSSWRLHDLWTVGVAVDGIAAIWALQGDAARAARLFGAANRLRGNTSALIPVIDRQLHGRVLETVRTHLGAGPFSVAYDAGAALPPDDVIAEAMRDVHMTGDRPAAIELTPRERDVLRLLIEGRTDAEMARALRLSTRTVSQHVGNMLSKSGSETRTALAVYAVRSSLA